MSARQVSNAFQTLKNAGLVEIAALNQKGYDRTRWYTLGPRASWYLTDQQSANIAPSNLQKSTVGSVENCGLEPAKIAGPIPERTREHTEKDCSSIEFNRFWTAYPRKEGRKNAQRAFSKLAPSVWPLLVPAVEKHKCLPQWQDKRYIPLPASWLNGERWADELDGQERPADSDQVPEGFQQITLPDGRKEWRRCETI